MAEPVGFEGASDLLLAPAGQGDAVKDLPIHRHKGGVISCWRLTPAEIEEVARTGVVWLDVLGTTHPPLYVSGDALVTVGDRPAKAEPGGI